MPKLSRRGKSLESLECIRFFSWVKANELHWPVLKLLIHVANEGRRSNRAGAELKSMGLRSGVADYLLLASGQIRGCNRVVVPIAIEMKTAIGKQSAEQKAWAALFESFGGKYYLCRSANEAVTVLKEHLGLVIG